MTEVPTNLLERQLPQESVVLGMEAVGFDLGGTIEPSVPIRNNAGDVVPVDIVASVESQDTPDRLIVFRHQNGDQPSQLGVGILSPDADPSLPPSLQGRLITSERPKGKTLEVQSVAFEGRNVGVTISQAEGVGTLKDTIYAVKRNPRTAVIPERSEAALAAPATISRFEKRERRRPSKALRLVGKVGLSAMLSTTPNGPAEMALDTFSDPQEMVSGIGKGKAKDSLVDIDSASAHEVSISFPREMDKKQLGLNSDELSWSNENAAAKHVNAYTLTENSSPEWLSKATEEEKAEESQKVENLVSDIDTINANYKESINEATQRLTETVHAMDVGDSEYFDNHRQAFLEKYGSEVISDEALQGTLRAIEEAETNEAVIQVLNSFTSTYGIEASLADGSSGNLKVTEVDLEGVQQFSKDIVSLISLFPSSEFHKVFGVKSIEFSKAASTDGSIVGGYAVGEGSSHVAISVGQYEDPTGLGLDIFTQNVGSEDVAHHEIGHTMVIPHLDKKWHTVLTPIGYELGRLFNRPAHPSAYSFVGESDERHAEVAAELFTEGITSPDRGLDFSSPVNKEKISILLGIEAEIPGISARFADRFSKNGESGNIVTNYSKQALERQLLTFASLALVLLHRKQRYSINRWPLLKN